MAVTEQREVIVAEAHAHGDVVHVNAPIPLTIEQSKSLRKEMKGAEQRARVLGELDEEMNEHVQEPFATILNLLWAATNGAPDSEEND